jgi:hypothetical protein
MTKTQSIVAALARIPRTGSLRRDLHDESEILMRKLRPALRGFRLGAIVSALLTLAAEHATELLEAEAAGCDCITDRKNGFYKCTSQRQHALTTLVSMEKSR